MIEIGILTLIGVAVFFFFAGAIAAYFILKNNPGIVERFAKDALAKKDKAISDLQKELDKLRGKSGG